MFSQSSSLGRRCGVVDKEKLNLKNHPPNGGFFKSMKDLGRFSGNEVLNFSKSALKWSILGFGLWKMSQLVTYPQLLGILERKDPRVASSVRDAVKGNPVHYGTIYQHAQNLDETAVVGIASQVSHAVSRGKGRAHNILIDLLAMADPHNQHSLDE